MALIYRQNPTKNPSKKSSQKKPPTKKQKEQARINAIKATKKRQQYARRKKILKKFHDFPTKNRVNFSRSEKALITKRWNQIAHLIGSDGELIPQVSYIKKPKPPQIDGAKVGKGFIYKFPGARLVKTKRGPVIAIKHGKVNRLFLPFPESIKGSFSKTKAFIDDIIKEYKPKYIGWSKRNSKRIQRYEPEKFEYYFQDIVDDELAEQISEQAAFLEEYESELDAEELKDEIRKLRLMEKMHEGAEDINGIVLTL